MSNNLFTVEQVKSTVTMLIENGYYTRCPPSSVARQESSYLPHT